MENAVKCDVDVKTEVELSLPEVEENIHSELERVISDISELRLRLHSTRCYIEMLQRELTEAVELEQKLDEQLQRQLCNELSIRMTIENGGLTKLDSGSAQVSGFASPQNRQAAKWDQSTVNAQRARKRLQKQLGKKKARGTLNRASSSLTASQGQQALAGAESKLEKSRSFDAAFLPPKSSNSSYQCQKCGLSFSSSTHLKSHLKDACDRLSQFPLALQSSDNVTIPKTEVGLTTGTITCESDESDGNAGMYKCADRQVCPTDAGKLQMPQIPPFFHQCPNCHLSYQHKYSLQKHLQKGKCQDKQLQQPNRRPAVSRLQMPLAERSTGQKKKNSEGSPDTDEKFGVNNGACFTCGKSDVEEWSKLSSRKLKEHICVECAKLILDQSLLKSSEEYVQYDIQPSSTCKRFVCLTCKRSEESLKRLWIHMRSHTGYRPHVCYKCGHACGTSVSLDLHIMAHQDKSSWIQCDVCMKTFSDKYRLKAHKATHESVKPFICSVCGAGYGVKAQLTIHMRYHSGDRRFACSICPKRYVTSCNLKKHMFAHSDEKSDQCRICSKYFKANGRALRKHMKTHLKLNNSSIAL